MITVKCAEIWGGIDSNDNDVQTTGISASLFSKAFEGKRGGDIYYFSVCGAGISSRIAIADVAGHGASVSDVSQWLYDALSHQMNTPDGNGVLNEMNQIAAEGGIKGITTASVFTVNNMDSTFSFSSAGHLPFFYHRKESNEWKEVTLKNATPRGNIPLGALKDTPFDEETLNVGSGDRFFLYTDGLTEAANQAGKAFGKNALLDTLNQSAECGLGEIKHQVIGALEKHLGGLQVQDDFTFLAVEIIKE